MAEVEKQKTLSELIAEVRAERAKETEAFEARIKALEDAHVRDAQTISELTTALVGGATPNAIKPGQTSTPKELEDFLAQAAEKEAQSAGKKK